MSARYRGPTGRGRVAWRDIDRSRPDRRHARCGVAWALAISLVISSHGARAQTHPDRQGMAQSAKPRKPKALPRATLLATAGAQSTAFDAVIHAALEKLHVVEVVSLPGMDLQAIQLLFDCVGETERCLKPVASHGRSRVLIAPSLQRTGGEMVVSLLRFDAAEGGTIRRVLRRQPGATLGSETLDAVPGMLRELFDLPPLEEPEPARALGSRQPSSMPPAARTAPEHGVSAAPLIVAAVGIAALGAGTALGVVMKNQQSEYERRSMNVRTRSQADSADRARSAGRSQALAANLLFVAGGAALATAAVWLVIDASAPARPEAPSAALAPVVGRAQLGLLWTQRGDVL